VRIYLFGYASDDFLARVVVTPNERTVAQLAGQLVAWGLAPERGGSLTVRNERGAQALVVDQSDETRGNRFGASRIDQQSRIAANLGQR